MIDTDAKRRKALSMFDLSDVWGIGPRTFAKLTALGVATPLQLADKPGEWVRRHFHQPGYQTWLELNGHPCIDTSEILNRQTITTSRSFGKMISSKEDLKASVASFAVAGSDREAWKNKKEHLTPNYLTDIDQIMTVQI